MQPRYPYPSVRNDVPFRFYKPRLPTPDLRLRTNLSNRLLHPVAFPLPFAMTFRFAFINPDFQPRTSVSGLIYQTDCFTPLYHPYPSVRNDVPTSKLIMFAMTFRFAFINPDFRPRTSVSGLSLLQRSNVAISI
jgi:hypothetical protein